MVDFVNRTVIVDEDVSRHVDSEGPGERAVGMLAATAGEPSVALIVFMLIGMGRLLGL